jgi:hypothetical protein
MPQAPSSAPHVPTREPARPLPAPGTLKKRLIQSYVLGQAAQSISPASEPAFDGPSSLHGFHLIVQPSAAVSDGSGSRPASTASSAARSQAASCDGSS